MRVPGRNRRHHLVSRSEHAPPGGTPRERRSHGHRPGTRTIPHRRGRGHREPRARRSAATRSSSASMARTRRGLHAIARPHRPLRLAARPGGARGRWRAPGRHRLRRLRLDDREDHRHRCDAHRGDRARPPRPRRDGSPGHTDRPVVPSRGARRAGVRCSRRRLWRLHHLDRDRFRAGGARLGPASQDGGNKPTSRRCRASWSKWAASASR